MTPASLDEGGGGGVGSKLKLQPANGDVHADKVTFSRLDCDGRYFVIFRGFIRISQSHRGEVT